VSCNMLGECVCFVVQACFASAVDKLGWLGSKSQRGSAGLSLPEGALLVYGTDVLLMRFATVDCKRCSQRMRWE